MVLDKDIHAELAAIVGLANIDDSDAMTDVYAYNWCMEVVNQMEGKDPVPYSPRPLAVVLPSTTDEVVGIVKACNAHGLTFKAQSTGLGPWNNPSTDNCIILDLRRMNKIVLIDEQNMLAVVEPYVSGAQLQIELMKLDLNCHMPGAGPQVSPLASATSMSGPGFTSPSTGHSSRNVLGVEWVLPDGQVLKLGAAGLEHEPGWYSGDGPGPSLRGIMRGLHGAKSGLGVFTKVGIKLFPFPCKVNWKVTGLSPHYQFEKPELMKWYIVDCKTYKSAEAFVQRVEEHEISFICSVLSNFGVSAIFASSIESLLGNAVLAMTKVPVVVLVAGRTRREFEYKTKVMQCIIEEDGLENMAGTKFEPPSISYAEALRSNLGLHGFIATGAFQSSHGIIDTLGVCLNATKKNIPVKMKYINNEQVANDFGEAVWSTSFEHGHMHHAEMLTLYDQTNPECVKGIADYFNDCNAMDLVQHLGIPFFIDGDARHDWYGPQCSNYNTWLRKIKTALDPACTADAGFYISPEKASNTTRNEKV
nr:FAD-binding oxidoreductase [Candidatus Sigynarchaeota archaeon]